MSQVTGDLKPNADILRTQLKQYPNVSRVITPFEWRVWNTGALLGSAASDDLGIVMGTFGTNVVTVQAGDLKAAGATTRYAIVQLYLPDYYDDGQSVTVRFHAGMQTTIADTSCTIDAEVYKVDDDGTPDGSDLCTTAATTMNSLTQANKDFTITPTDLVGGDILEIRVAIACNDGATGTAVTPTIYKAALLFDARG